MSGLGRTRTISDSEHKELMRTAVSTKHPDIHKVLSGSKSGQLQRMRVKKQMVVPVEETVQVPVVKKEVRPNVEVRILKGRKMMPVQKFKEVQETTLEVKHVMVNGRKEKRAMPVTRTRRIPYTDYEPKEVDIKVKVPMEEVDTRQGHRFDKCVTGKVVEVEEDHVYEMRPVLVKKENTRMTEKGEHHAYKMRHGPPAWEDKRDGWSSVPRTPRYKPHLHRPNSAGSLASTTCSVRYESTGKSMGLTRSASTGTQLLTLP